MKFYFVPLFLGVLLLPFLAISSELDGLWKVEGQKMLGSERDPGFRFIRFEKDKMFVSRGADWAEGWVDVQDGSIRIVGGWPFVWEDGVYCEVFDPAKLTIDGDRVTITYGVSTVSDTPIEELIFRRVGDNEAAKFSFRARTKDQQEAIETLRKLGVSFEFDEFGFAISADLSIAAVGEEYLMLLRLLPKLSKVGYGRSVEMEFKGAPESFVQAAKEWRQGQSNFFWTSQAGVDYRKGRRAMVELTPLREERGSVFFAESDGEEVGAPAILVPFRDKIYVVHRRFHPGQIPQSMVSAALKSPIPIGQVMVDQLGFQIRTLNGNPPSNLVFEPYPSDKLALYDGRKLKVLGVGGSVEAYLSVLILNGQDWIAPLSPLDWGLAKVCLITDPDEPISIWSGCPVIDDETGYLIGLTSQFKLEGDTKMYNLEPIGELFRVGVPPIKPTETFFGIKNVPADVMGRFSGIIPGSLLQWRLGVTQAEEVVANNPAFLGSCRRIPLGRQHLFSMVEPGARGTGEIRSIELSGKQLRIDDEKLETYLSSMLRIFGEPAELYTAEEKGIGMKWQTNEGMFVYSHVKFDSTFNNATAGLLITPRGDENPFYSLEKASSGDARAEVDQFLKFISEQEPEPHSFIRSSEAYKQAIDTLLEKLKERIEKG